MKLFNFLKQIEDNRTDIENLRKDIDNLSDKLSVLTEVVTNISDEHLINLSERVQELTESINSTKKQITDLDAVYTFKFNKLESTKTTKKK